MSVQQKIPELPPGFVRRSGDKVIEGANNALIIIGTDRAAKGPATPSDGLGTLEKRGTGTGTIHAVVGRKDKNGDPDFDKDDSFLYLTMKSQADENLQTEDIVRSSGKTAAAILKSDAVRLVARESLKIVLRDGTKNIGYIFFDKTKIELNIADNKILMDSDGITLKSVRVKIGEGAQEHMILGDSFYDQFLNHTHPSAVGPTGQPIDQRKHLSADHLVE